MQLKPNTYYKTRDGRKAFVLGCHSIFQSYAWVGYIESEAAIRRWDDGGNCGTVGGDARDLICEWQDAPVVGSYEWAMALPEGAKIRWHSWERCYFVERVGDRFTHGEYRGLLGPEPSDTTGWILYTEPKLRPWRHDEVPLGAWMRENGGFPALIVAILSNSLIRGHGYTIDFEYALKHYEHSTDGGKTWRPCGVEE